MSRTDSQARYAAAGGHLTLLCKVGAVGVHCFLWLSDHLKLWYKVSLCVRNRILPYLVCKKLYANRVVCLNSVGKKCPDDLLFPPGFWGAHSIDTFLSHEAAGKDLWMAVKQCNMTVTIWWILYIQISFMLHTFILYRTFFFKSHEVCFKPNVVPNIQYAIWDAAHVSELEQVKCFIEMIYLIRSTPSQVKTTIWRTNDPPQANIKSLHLWLMWHQLKGAARATDHHLALISQSDHEGWIILLSNFHQHQSWQAFPKITFS